MKEADGGCEDGHGDECMPAAASTPGGTLGRAPGAISLATELRCDTGGGKVESAIPVIVPV